MRDKDKTKEQLLNELVEMRQRISELETAETQRQRAEEALQESERRYRLLAENITDVIWIMDMNLRYTYVSPSITRLRGYTADEVMAGTAEDTLTPASLEIARKVLAEELAKERKGQKDLFRSWTLELEMNCKDGSTVWTEAKITVLREPGDPLPKMLGVTRDITDRKQAEEVVRQAEKRYRAIFDNRLQMVYVNNEQGLFLDANDYALERLGYTRDDLGKLSLQDVLHPEDLPKTVEAVADVLAKGFMEHPIELRGITKSGETIWIETFGIPVERGVDHFIGLGIARDITDRKRSDEERERLLQELGEKTRELEQIVFVASHDLRSPLVNIQGFTRELQQSLEEVRSALESEDIPSAVKDKIAVPVNEDIPDAFRHIFASSAKIDSLLSGLLRLSRLGRAALTMEKLDMDELMADVIRALEFFVKGAGATVQVEDLPPCRGDRTQINQVFSNLIDNASKFLDANRTGIIRVSGWSEDGQAVYCVEDNGIGVAPEHQERVFEIFQRLDPSANSGEGLGLAIVRRILERHAGKAWVKSEPGKGSKFFVSLPTV